MTSAQQFQDHMSAHVKVSTGMFGFSASSSYQQRSRTLSNYQSIIVSMKKECHLFTVDVNRYNPPHLDKSFSKALDSALTTSDMYTFLDTYGQFYVQSMIFGFRSGSLSVISKTSYEKSNSSGFSVEAGIEMSTFGFSAGADSSKDQASKLANMNIITTKYSIGKQLDDWRVSQIQSAAPLIYKLGNLYDILGLAPNQRKKLKSIFLIMCT